MFILAKQDPIYLGDGEKCTHVELLVVRLKDKIFYYVYYEVMFCSCVLQYVLVCATCVHTRPKLKCKSRKTQTCKSKTTQILT